MPLKTSRKVFLIVSISLRLRGQFSNWLSSILSRKILFTRFSILVGLGFSRERMAASVESASMMMPDSLVEGLGPR